MLLLVVCPLKIALNSTKEISMIYWYNYIYMFDLDEGEDMPFWCIIAQIMGM